MSSNLHIHSQSVFRHLFESTQSHPTFRFVPSDPSFRTQILVISTISNCVADVEVIQAKLHKIVSNQTPIFTGRGVNPFSPSFPLCHLVIRLSIRVCCGSSSTEPSQRLVIFSRLHFRPKDDKVVRIATIRDGYKAILALISSSRPNSSY